MGFMAGEGMAGAAGGAMMGAPLGPIGMGVGAIAGGLLGGFGSKKAKGGLEAIWPQWKFNPGAEAGYRAGWGNIQNQQEALSRGELPSYFQRYAQGARKSMADPLYRTYFGSGGSQGPGMLNRQFEAASMAGANPKAATRAMSKGLYDYANQVQQIDFTMNQLGYDQMNNAMENSFRAADPRMAGEWQTPTYLDTRTPGTQVGSQLLGMGIGMMGEGGLKGLFGGGAKTTTPIGAGNAGLFMNPNKYYNNMNKGFAGGLNIGGQGFSGINVPLEYGSFGKGW